MLHGMYVKIKYRSTPVIKKKKTGKANSEILLQYLRTAKAEYKATYEVNVNIICRFLYEVRDRKRGS